MGCNCGKNKNTDTSKKTPSRPVMITEVTPTKETATLEEVDKALDYLKSTSTKTDEERFWFNQFIKEHVGELIIGYCDIVCKNRLMNKLNIMKTKL